MTEKRYTLEELTKEVNLRLSMMEYTTTDSRQSKDFSPRRIRDLATKDLIAKPFRDGRNVYYTEQHVQELVDLKTLQSKGMTDKSLISLKSESQILEEPTQNSDEKQDLLNLISDIKEESTQYTSSDRSILGASHGMGKSNDLMSTLSSYVGTKQIDSKDLNIDPSKQEELDALRPKDFNSDNSITTNNSNLIAGSMSIESDSLVNDDINSLLETSSDFDVSESDIPLHNLDFPRNPKSALPRGILRSVVEERKTELKPEEWDEYNLADNIKFKIKKDTKIEDLEKLLEQIKQINKQTK